VEEVSVETPIKYPWQQFVVDAFLEFKPELLPAKVNIAERAISERLYDDSLDREEQLAMRDALIALRTLIPVRERVNESEKCENTA
jgi:hypothetical protein